MAANVLVVDNDPTPVHTVQSALDRAYCTLHSSPPETRSLSTIARRPSDLIDPAIGEDGLGCSFCPQLLDLGGVPLFLFLASTRQPEHVPSLDVGARNSVSRALYSPVELAAKLHAVLRPKPRGRHLRAAGNWNPTRSARDGP